MGAGMTWLDWVLAVGLNLLVFGIGAVLSRRTRSSLDWFLGGKALPFWLAGLSMFATSLDAAEQIAVSGHTFVHGISILSHYWLGLPVAYVIAAFWVLPRMYRAGLFTNAEYLEGRFGISSRVLSVIIQLQYRTNIMASMSIALHLVLTEVVKLDSAIAWVAVGLFAAVTAVYTAAGGLKTMALTDAILSAIMIAGTVIFWLVLLDLAGGWGGLVEGLETADRGHLLHIGAPEPGGPPIWVTILQWVIIAVGFVIVNHTQTMKMLGARSLWDLKLSVLIATAVMAPIIFMNATFSIIGQVVLPESVLASIGPQTDQILPTLIDLFLGPGLKGIVVAGVVAAAVGTYEGIASALGALVSRDLYARLIAPGRDDAHYLRAGRIATIAIVAGSFLYIPFILRYENIMSFFLRITNIFVTPLMVVYVMGAFTRVHRKSAPVALLVGPAFGLMSLACHGRGWLPPYLTDPSWTYLWSVLISSISMLVTSLLLGWEAGEDPEGSEKEDGHPGRWREPWLWAAVMMGLACYFVFFRFW